MYNKLKLTFKKAFGFRTLAATEIALYHALGDLPEPPVDSAEERFMIRVL